MMERLVEFQPAYDKRNPDPDKNYGIHGMDLRFVLKGKKGATQFVIYTNWYLPHVTQEMLRKPIKDRIDLECRFLPMPADVGYHSPVPMYEGQSKASDDCPYTDGECYYDGSGLQAEELFIDFLVGGDKAVWERLEQSYISHFGSLDE